MMVKRFGGNAEVSEHEDYMRIAIEIARGNARAPFGTVLVDPQKQSVMAAGLNDAAMNPIWPGEIDAIHRFAQHGDGRWSKLRLYTTAEPCCMCQAAIMWAGIPEVVFGTSIEQLVQFGWQQFELTAERVAASAPFAECTIIGGVLADECDRLFQGAKA